MSAASTPAASSNVAAPSDAAVEAAYARYPVCSCRRRPVVDISTTAANPQRRFLRCPLKMAYQCGFFRWVDPWNPPTQIEAVNDGVEREKLKMWISMNTRLNKQCELLEENLKELRIAINELKAEKEGLLLEREELIAEMEHVRVENGQMKNKFLMIKVVVGCLFLVMLSVILA